MSLPAALLVVLAALRNPPNAVAWQPRPQRWTALLASSGVSPLPAHAHRQRRSALVFERHVSTRRPVGGGRGRRCLRTRLFDTEGDFHRHDQHHQRHRDQHEYEDLPRADEHVPDNVRWLSQRSGWEELVKGKMWKKMLDDGMDDKRMPVMENPYTKKMEPVNLDRADLRDRNRPAVDSRVMATVALKIENGPDVFAMNTSSAAEFDMEGMAPGFQKALQTMRRAERAIFVCSPELFAPREQLAELIRVDLLPPDFRFVMDLRLVDFTAPGEKPRRLTREEAVELLGKKAVVKKRHNVTAEGIDAPQQHPPQAHQEPHHPPPAPTEVRSEPRESSPLPLEARRATLPANHPSNTGVVRLSDKKHRLEDVDKSQLDAQAPTQEELLRKLEGQMMTGVSPLWQHWNLTEPQERKFQEVMRHQYGEEGLDQRELPQRGYSDAMLKDAATSGSHDAGFRIQGKSPHYLWRETPFAAEMWVPLRMYKRPSPYLREKDLKCDMRPKWMSIKLQNQTVLEGPWEGKVASEDAIVWCINEAGSRGLDLSAHELLPPEHMSEKEDTDKMRDPTQEWEDVFRAIARHPAVHVVLSKRGDDFRLWGGMLVGG